MVLLVGADAALVEGVLERLGDDDLVVLDESAERLELLEDGIADPRVWFMIGDPKVIPLPDRIADEVVGVEASPEVERVTR